MGTPIRPSLPGSAQQQYATTTPFQSAWSGGLMGDPGLAQPGVTGATTGADEVGGQPDSAQTPQESPQADNFAPVTGYAAPASGVAPITPAQLYTNIQTPAAAAPKPYPSRPPAINY